AAVDTAAVVGEDVGDVELVLRRVVAVREERLVSEAGNGLFDALDPPPLALVEQRPGDVRPSRRHLSSPHPFALISSPSASSVRPCQRSAPGVALSLAMRPCIGVPSTSTIASRAA